METVKDCNYPWTWMMVTSDGRARPCCFATSDLGNLQTQPIEEIWNGPLAVELRQFVLANKIHKICENAACKFVQNMDAKRAASGKR